MIELLLFFQPAAAQPVRLHFSHIKHFLKTSTQLPENALVTVRAVALTEKKKKKSHQNVFHARVMKFAPSATSLISPAKFHCRGGINDAIVIKELRASDDDRREGR